MLSLNSIPKIKKWSFFWVIAYVLVWLLFFSWFWSHALYIDDVHNQGSIVAGHPIVWADWALHITMTTAIAERGVEMSPLMLGEKLAYPYFANALSALLVRASVPLLTSLIVPSFLASISVVVLLIIFYNKVLFSWKQAILATHLFFVSGGLGFVYAFNKVFDSISVQMQNAQNIPQSIFLLVKHFYLQLLHPEMYYTLIPEQEIYWANMLHAMLIPQRSFLFGILITLLAFLLLHKCRTIYLQKKGIAQVFLAGTLLGLLPFIHMHSFLSAGILLAGWSIAFIFAPIVLNATNTEPCEHYKITKKNIVSRVLIVGFLGVTVLSIAIPILFRLQAFDQSAISIQIGWMLSEINPSASILDWIFFVIKNWGLMVVGSLLSLFFAYKQQKLFLFSWALPFFILFVLAHCISFQPHLWDNTKMFAWAHLGMSGVFAWGLSQLWRRSQSLLIGTLILGTVFTITTLAGTLDLYHLLRNDLQTYTFITNDEIELAQWVQKHTDVDSIWLTSDTHNHWLPTLTGRQIVMAYRGWLWTHGYEYHEYESMISGIYTNPYANHTLLHDLNVSYIVVGPHEINTWNANVEEWKLHFSLLHTHQNTFIFTSHLKDVVDQQVP